MRASMRLSAVVRGFLLKLLRRGGGGGGGGEELMVVGEDTIFLRRVGKRRVGADLSKTLGPSESQIPLKL